MMDDPLSAAQAQNCGGPITDFADRRHFLCIGIAHNRPFCRSNAVRRRLPTATLSHSLRSAPVSLPARNRHSLKRRIITWRLCCAGCAREIQHTSPAIESFPSGPPCPQSWIRRFQLKNLPRMFRESGITCRRRSPTELGIGRGLCAAAARTPAWDRAR